MNSGAPSESLITAGVWGLAYEGSFGIGFPRGSSGGIFSPVWVPVDIMTAGWLTRESPSP